MYLDLKSLGNNVQKLVLVNPMLEKSIDCQLNYGSIFHTDLIRDDNFTIQLDVQNNTLVRQVSS